MVGYNNSLGVLDAVDVAPSYSVLAAPHVGLFGHSSMRGNLPNSYSSASLFLALSFSNNYQNRMKTTIYQANFTLSDVCARRRILWFDISRACCACNQGGISECTSAIARVSCNPFS